MLPIYISTLLSVIATKAREKEIIKSGLYLLRAFLYSIKPSINTTKAQFTRKTQMPKPTSVGDIPNSAKDSGFKKPAILEGDAV